MRALPRIMVLRCRGLLALLAVLTGCTDSEPERAERLELIAVKADPPSGVPGSTIDLEVFHSAMIVPSNPSDARSGGAAGKSASTVSASDAALTRSAVLSAQGDGWGSLLDDSSVRVLWLGGCHNPPAGEYYGCLPTLRSIVGELPDPILDEFQDPPGAEGWVGAGTHFALPIPEDVVVATASGPQGVSYAFVAACRGELRPRLDLEDTIPLRCYGPDGAELGNQDFAVGFTTIRTVPGVSNANPELSALRLDGVTLERRACTSSADCAALGGAAFDYDCGADRECWPVVPRCTGVRGGCEPLRLSLVVADEAAEELPEGSASRPRETLSGEVWSVLRAEHESEEIYPGHGAEQLDVTFPLRAPADGIFGAGQPIPLLAFVRDGRGGTGWLEWSFLVPESGHLE